MTGGPPTVRAADPAEAAALASLTAEERRAELVGRRTEITAVAVVAGEGSC